MLGGILGIEVESYTWKQIPSGADVPIDDNQIIVTFKYGNSTQNIGKMSFGDNSRVFIKAQNTFGTGEWVKIAG